MAAGDTGGAAAVLAERDAELRRLQAALERAREHEAHMQRACARAEVRMRTVLVLCCQSGSNFDMFSSLL